jgi:hypothetical protein
MRNKVLGYAKLCKTMAKHAPSCPKKCNIKWEFFPQSNRYNKYKFKDDHMYIFTKFELSDLKFLHYKIANPWAHS